jgi:transformation/transcription domain-associated protein
MWIEQWVSCAKNLSQWDVLDEYARETHNYELSIDCLWRLQDWVGLKNTLTNKVVQVSGCCEHVLIFEWVCSEFC